LSIRQASKAVNISLSVYYYKQKPREEDAVIIGRLEQLAENHSTYGFRKMYHVLRSKGHWWNHKRVKRVYVMMGLNIRRKRKRRLPARVKTPHIIPIQGNITWSADFMHDSLINGKTFRTFNVIDDHNREALMINVDTSLSSHRIVRELDRLIEWRGAPEVIRVDNGPEFTSATFEAWARKHRIKICFIQPGKPTQNSLIERFNGTYRKEVLNAHLFSNLNEVRDKTQEWIWVYNNTRPHESLNNKPPVEFRGNRSLNIPTYLIDKQIIRKTIFTTASN
jgi:putative transposase